MKVNFQYVINLKKKKKNYDFLPSYILRDIVIVLKYLKNKKIKSRWFRRFEKYLIKLQEILEKKN